MNQLLNRKIKTITLYNFQNHKISKIPLTDRLNLLVGSSDSGKTAIARAYDFVMHNNSEGHEFVHIGEKVATVEIEFQDGSVIRRLKGDRLNKVEYKYAGQEEFTVRSSFGSNYLKDVLDFLGHPPKSSQLGAMAYSNQLNKNFLVDQDETQLPKIISDLVGVSDLEEGSSLLSSKVRSLDINLKSIEKEIESINEKLDNDFIDLDKNVDTSNLIKQYIKDCDQLEKDMLVLKSYQDKYSSIIRRGNDAHIEKNNAEKIIGILENRIEDMLELVNSLSTKKIVYGSVVKCENELVDATKEFNKYSAICDGEFNKKINEICQIKNNLSSLLEFSDIVDENINDQNQLNKEINELKTSIKNMQTQYDELLEEAKEKKYYCGSCNKIGGQLV